MDEKSLEILEFPRIREILAGFTSFSVSHELAMQLKPRSDFEYITLLLKQADEARRLLAVESGFTIEIITDVRNAAKIASLEAILEPQMLLEVQQTLASLHRLRTGLSKISEEFPLLWKVAKEIVELNQIEKDIASCIDVSGEVLDAASPALAGIRQQQRSIRNQILERLEAIIRSPRGQRILQEQIITEREGRYVILVKIERRHEIKGIVHDISNTEATVFVEPTATVGLGNALRELAIEEKREIERILSILSAEVGASSDEISRNIEIAADIDLTLAKARYARKIKAAVPGIADPGESNSRESKKKSTLLKLVKARHPLLDQKAVPFSVEIGQGFTTLVITGPNTGGKTVTLKTIGLLNVMAQASIPIPASEESQLPVFDNIFADIGDEQSIEHTLSTFSWHMSNIVRIVRGATENSLVLLDELGTSTDPTEGSALARATLRYFKSKNVLTVATTHYSDLKAFAYATPGFENASLDFDPATLAPTYNLTIGIPGGSNAMATALRLGLPSEIIDDARGMLTKGSQELEILLANLMKEKQKTEALRQNLISEKDNLAKKTAEVDKERIKIKEEEKKAIQEARDGITREAAEIHREIRRTAAALRKEKSAENLDNARRALAEVRAQLDTERWQTRSEEGTADTGRINIGDVVRIKEVGMLATVNSIIDETQEIEVQMGQTKMRLKMNGVEKAAASAKQNADRANYSKKTTTVRNTPLELDLRGKRADEVEPALENYINDAAQFNLGEARIIHGYGTGTVRNIVREFLASHPLIRSFRSGQRDEGGDGVTVAELQ